MEVKTVIEKIKELVKKGNVSKIVVRRKGEPDAMVKLNNDWTPKAPLYMFHSTEDNMVPFLNSERLSEQFKAKKLGNIEYDFDAYGNHMNGAVTFFEKVYRMLL